MRALLSVSDKSGIVDFAKELVSLGFEIISTGGTRRVLEENNINVIDISEVTKFPECFGGRVKTLNPYIHGGILYRSNVDQKEAEKLNIKRIDLVAVNLYPFKQTTQKTDDFDEIIENIDIGGPTLIRSAAKNFKDVLVVVDPDDYDKVIQAIKEKRDNISFRKEL